MDDHRDRFIGRVSDGKTFADIGGLWGLVSEKISAAARAGARQLTMIDIHPPDDHAWSELDDRLQSVGVDSYRCVSGSVDDEQLLRYIGSFDVVHCSGVLYHCPNPLHTLTRIRRLTEDHLVLTSMVFPEHIVTEVGDIYLRPGEHVFIPGLAEGRRAVLEAFLHGRGVHGALGIDVPVERWHTDDYAPWWWALTAPAIVQLVEAAGFEVQETATSWEGLAFTLLARPLDELGGVADRGVQVRECGPGMPRTWSTPSRQGSRS